MESDITFVPPIDEKNNPTKTTVIYNSMPNLDNGPVGDYYVDIDWKDGFENWDLIRISTPSDGNCLFHALANSYFPSYWKGELNGKKISRYRIVTVLRKEIADELTKKISEGKILYETLSGGNIKSFAKDVPEFSLSNMQKQLSSSSCIGYGYIELIGTVLEKDIYILDGERKDIYVMDELHYSIKGNRKSVILYYHNNHYELVGIKNKEGFTTHFSPDHSLIQFLRERVRKIIDH